MADQYKRDYVYLRHRSGETVGDPEKVAVGDEMLAKMRQGYEQCKPPAGSPDAETEE